MARQRKGNGRRGRKAKREIKRVWAELRYVPEIIFPSLALSNQRPVTEVASA